MKASPSSISKSSNLSEKKDWAESVFTWYVKRKGMLCTFSPITVTSIDRKGNVITVQPRNPSVHILMSYPYLTSKNNEDSIINALHNETSDAYILTKKVVTAFKQKQKPTLSVEEIKTVKEIKSQSESLHKFLKENSKRPLKNRLKAPFLSNKKSQ